MLSWEFPPASAGGMAAHIDGLTQALADGGHDVVLLTRLVPDSETETMRFGVRVLRADVDMPWLPDNRTAHTASANHALVRLAELLGDWSPDVVHAHDWEVAWAAEVFAGRFDAPLVTTFHGTARGRHGGHLGSGDPTDINAVEWWQALRSDQIITITKLMVREIVGGFEIDPNRVRRIPNGIDPMWWMTSSPDEVADTERTREIFTWGRVQYEKGFQVLSRSMMVLRNRMPDARCIIAGRGSYLPELQSQIDVDGVTDIVDLRGYVSDNDLRALAHRAGCVVIPSLYEPFGVVALEALAAGAPLIVADTGGLAELVGGTGSALLFEPGNAAELADCIERVLTEPDLAATMRASGHQLLSATYSWKAIASRTVLVYEDAKDTFARRA